MSWPGASWCPCRRGNRATAIRVSNAPATSQLGSACRELTYVHQGRRRQGSVFGAPLGARGGRGRRSDVAPPSTAGSHRDRGRKQTPREGGPLPGLETPTRGGGRGEAGPPLRVAQREAVGPGEEAGRPAGRSAQWCAYWNDRHHACTESEVHSAYLSTLTDSKLQGGPGVGTAVPVTGRPSWGPREGPRSLKRGLQPGARGGRGGGELRRFCLPPKQTRGACRQVGPAAHGHRDPAPHGTLLPNEATGTAGRTRPFPGSYLKQVIKVGSIPPAPGSGSGALPDTLPTPLAEIQGDFSL